MSRRVFILGSGFSKAVHAGMPTMSELSDAVRGSLRSDGLPLPPGHDTPVSADFERWLSYLVDAPPWLSSSQQERNHASFAEIANAVSETLGAVQMKAALVPQPRWLPALTRHWHETNTTVLTFNYDVLVELAWLDLYGGPNTPWSHLYAVPLTPAGSRSAAVLGGTRPTNGMRLLKLHGSLTWFYSGPGAPPGDTVYDVGVTGPWSSDGVIPRYDDHDVADKVPFIVPPAAVKSPYYTNQLLGSQWRLAAQAITDAEEIVVMGFGLPPTDLLVSSMLATLVTPDHTVVPVSPDPKLPARLRALLEPSGPTTATSLVVDRYTGKPDPITNWVNDNT